MQPTLAAVSFVSAALLALFIPIARVRCNVANLAVVAWLVGANFVHGINAIIWAGNVELRVPVWCDIVTKLLVGATVAIPGAMVSMSYRLELVSSRRSISNEPKNQTARIMADFLLCYIIPTMYMGLHFIAQGHRFDLIEDYGCSASIHPSAVGLILMWLPPILLCLVSFLLCAASISHLFRMSAANFSLHLEQRSPFTSSMFIRRLSTIIIITCVLFVVSLFSVFTISRFLPWTTWSAAHANFASINVVRSEEEMRSIKLVWVGVPVVSLVYVALILVLGEEARDAYKWIRDRVREMPQWRPRPLMLLPLFSAQTRADMESRTRLSTPPPESALELKSGWDDMFEDKKKKPKLWSPIRKSPTSLRTASPTPLSVKTASPLHSRSSTPTPSSSVTSSSTVCGEDEAFIKSTMEYLGSPVAKTLGISPTPLVIPSTPLSPSTPISSPDPVYFSPTKSSRYNIATSPTSVRSAHDVPPSPRNVPSDVESVISSVFDASWPQPPLSQPILSPTASRYRSAPPQPNESATDVLAFGVPLRPAVTPPHRRARPFEGSSISSITEVPDLPQTRQKRTPSVKGLLRTFSAEKVHDARGPVIYMHVVNEVA